MIIDDELEELENVLPMDEDEEDNDDDIEDEVIVVEKKYTHTEAAEAMDLLKSYLLSNTKETHILCI